MAVLPPGHPERRQNLADWNKSNKLVDEQGNPLTLYRGAVGHKELPEGFLQGKTRSNYATFTSTSPSLASTYANVDRSSDPDAVGGVMPIHAHAHVLHEFPTKGPSFDKFAFDKFARSLPKGHAVVARQVLDIGPRASNATDPEKRYSYPSDIYAWNEANSVKSAIGNRGTFDPNDPDITKAGGGEVEDEGITAYHGSPHDFDEFDLSKIGTGEGAQAYGHGLYFAEKENVAQYYRDTLGDPRKQMQAPRTDLERRTQDAIKKYLEDIGDDAWDDVSNIRHGVINEVNRNRLPVEAIEAFDNMHRDGMFPNILGHGHMYEVRINAHPDHFLDWDKPLSKQSEYVQNALAQHAPLQKNRPYKDTDLGTELYYKNTQGLSGGPTASDELLRLGIKGIKYLDAGSRGAGEGSRNYVVFDDKLVNVKRKYADGGEV